MAKRVKREPSVRVSFRWSAGVAAMVSDWAERTGWSDAKVAGELARVGNCAMCGQLEAARELGRDFQNAENIRKAQAKADEIVRVARAQARAASGVKKSRRVLDEGV